MPSETEKAELKTWLDKENKRRAEESVEVANRIKRAKEARENANIDRLINGRTEPDDPRRTPMIDRCFPRVLVAFRTLSAPAANDPQITKDKEQQNEQITRRTDRRTIAPRRAG